MKSEKEPVIDRVLAYTAYGLIGFCVIINLWRYISAWIGLDPGPGFPG